MSRKILIIFFLLIVITAFSKAATYYVSPTGNDDNAGTLISTAWKTTEKVNAVNFLPGDIILFEGGATFGGTLYFDAGDPGSAASPIIVSSYGTGSATINSGTQVGMYVYNTAGFEIKNINFFGAGSTLNESSGILIYMDSACAYTRLQHILIDHVEVKGYKTDGISTGSYYGSNGFDGVTITNCIVHDIGFIGIGSYAQSNIAHTNLYIAYNKVYNISGNGDPIQHSGSGIVVSAFDGAVVEHCETFSNGEKNTSTPSGPMGIWAYNSNNVTIQYNESHHNQTQGRDGGGFDFDGGVSNSVMQYNYSHDNAGAGYLLVQKSSSATWHNNIIRNNKSVNDGLKNNYAAIHFYSANIAGGINGAEIYDNEIVNPYSRGVGITSSYIYNTVIKNNSFRITNGAQAVSASADNPTVKFEKNDYSDPASFKVFWAGRNYYTLKAWRDSTFQENVILREVWRNVAGANIASIPIKNIPSEVSYLNDYETPQNLTDSYGERISGYITAPQTGNYTFWVSGDDDCSLYLSPDANPRNKAKIAGLTGRTNFREFTKYDKQKSPLIFLTSGQIYYIEVLHKDSVAADHVTIQWQLPDGTIQVPVPYNGSGVILPARFITFDGFIKNNNAILNWTTANEINNKGFEIERSYDGETFTKISFIKANAVVSQINKYTYTDNKILSGANYYRLKQIDNDGRFNYSSVLKLDYRKFNWAIIANPGSNTSLQLQLNKTADVAIQIFSLSGIKIKQINKGYLNAGTYSIPINITATAHGVYIVKLVIDKQYFSGKIIR